MARTYGKIKVEVWESGSDYRALPTAVQWTYQMLVSQPNITQAGVLNYVPRKWSRLSADMTSEILEELVSVLEVAGYVIVDRETEELLVRSFIKHDEPWRLRNNLTSARSQYRAVESVQIRDYLRERHPWLDDLEIEPEAIQEHEREYVRSHRRSDVRSDDRDNARSNGVLLAGVASNYPEPDPSKGRKVQGSTPQPPTPLEAMSAAEEPLPVKAECPVCGPLHDVGVGFSLEDHVGNVHGLDLADVL